MRAFQNMRGLWREYLAWHQRGLESARAMGLRQDEGTLLNNIGLVYDNLGERRRALEVYEQALAISREVGGRAGEATTLNNIGLVYDNLGDRRRALEVYEQALSIRREVGDRAGEAATLNNIGAVYYALGDRRRALEVYEQALPIRREVGDRAGEATTLNNIGRVYNALGDRRRALEVYEQALPIRREWATARARRPRSTTSAWCTALWETITARARFTSKPCPSTARWARAVEKVTLFNIAMIRQAEGDYAEAVRLLEQVVALDEAIEHPDLEGDRAALQAARRKAGET